MKPPTGTEPAALVAVAHCADYSAATTSLLDFLRWAKRSGRADRVGLWALSWETGPAAGELAATVPTIDIGQVLANTHTDRLAAAGLNKLAGGLTGRRVRQALAPLATARVVYLNTGFAGWCLRYLPTTGAEVVTHIHELDRERADDLLADDRRRLVAATDRWLAASEELADWAAMTFGVAAGAVEVMPPVIDPVDDQIRSQAERRRRLGVPPDTALIGILGAPSWAMGPDHTGRFLAAFHRLRPEVALHLLWADLVTDDRHLWPEEEEARRAGGATLHRMVPEGRPFADLDLIDVLAVTSADNRLDAAGWTAAAHGKPLVCFDTHRMAPVAAQAGVIIPYPDAESMASSVLQLLDHPEERAALGARARAVASGERGGDPAGSRLLDVLTRRGAARSKPPPARAGR